MRTIRRATRTLTTILAIATALVLGAVTVPSASAGPAWAVDEYNICVDAGCIVGTYGTVVWGNRTATVDGTVYDLSSEGYSSLHFDAFAGSTKVDSEVISPVWKPGEDYSFVIGDPNRVGGIDRVRVQACWRGSFTQCSTQFNMIRN
jgi:hypothetical protein